MKKLTPADLEAEFNAEKQRLRGDQRCSLAVLLDEIDPALAKVLRANLEDQDVSAGSYARVLKKLELPPISDKTVRDHRRKACKCHR